MKRYYKDISGSRIWYKGVIIKDGKQIFTWDETLILADGWTLYVPEPIPPYQPTVKELIQQEIRERYDASDEWMILRRYASDFSNPEYQAAFDEYNAFVEEVLAKYENDV